MSDIMNNCPPGNSELPAILDSRLPVLSPQRLQTYTTAATTPEPAQSLSARVDSLSNALVDLANSYRQLIAVTECILSRLTAMSERADRLASISIPGASGSNQSRPGASLTSEQETATLAAIRDWCKDNLGDNPLTGDVFIEKGRYWFKLRLAKTATSSLSERQLTGLFRRKGVLHRFIRLGNEGVNLWGLEVEDNCPHKGDTLTTAFSITDLYEWFDGHMGDPRMGQVDRADGHYWFRTKDLVDYVCAVSDPEASISSIGTWLNEIGAKRSTRSIDGQQVRLRGMPVLLTK